MPLTLADGRDRLVVFTNRPVNLDAITAAECALAINASPLINKPDFRLSATTSDTVPDQPLSSSGNATTYGASNYEGSITPFRFLDNNGATVALEDILFAAIGAKGIRVWLAYRKGPKSAVAMTNLDRYNWYEVITDTPQEPSDRAGYIKQVIPLGIQDAGTGIVAGVAVAPQIGSALPVSALATKIVTITGALFTGATAVTFNAIAATAFQVLNDNMLVATMPAGSAGVGNIIVTTPAGPSTAFTYTRGA